MSRRPWDINRQPWNVNRRPRREARRGESFVRRALLDDKSALRTRRPVDPHSRLLSDSRASPFPRSRRSIRWSG